MKKIMISLVALAVIALGVYGVTSAYFSDTESSDNNTFAAGTMDLNINGDNVSVTSMTLTNKAPGDAGVVTGTAIKNVGSLAGELDVVMGTVNNYACTDSANGGVDDGTEFCTSDAGALGVATEVALYLDIDKSDTWTTGDVGLKFDGNVYVNGGTDVLDYDAIDNYSGVIWDEAVTSMAKNDEYGFVIDWQVATSAGNEIQGDALDFGLSFVLEQADVD